MSRSAEAVLDEYLVLVAQSGSADAFRRLVERWTPRLKRHALHTLRDADAAADAVQEAWLAIATGIRGLADPAKFPAWAHAITTRKCVDEVRRRRRRRTAAEAAEAPSTVEEDAELSLDLASALSALPIDQRMMVGLVYGRGLSVDEVARLLGLPVGTVKSRLHSIRKTLKTLLEGESHVPD